MKRRTLGSQGFEVSAIGLGCMGMTFAYGHNDRQQAINTLHRAFDLGVDFLDTAEVYGPFNNEELLAEALKVYQGRNEQGMAHVATGFARQSNRRRIIACASSIGPGAANMVTAAKKLRGETA